jgi:hypothetical protein
MLAIFPIVIDDSLANQKEDSLMTSTSANSRSTRKRRAASDWWGVVVASCWLQDSMHPQTWAYCGESHEGGVVNSRRFLCPCLVGQEVKVH